MSDPEWRVLEKVVAVLESHLDEGASVEHNVHLPVLNSPSGSTRQCDVVVTQGKKPRQTVSIVEVQARDEKVNINDFNGWLVKRDDVGAQHLICVSEEGYPQSVMDKAAVEGPSVRLLTLKQLKDDGWPIPLHLFRPEVDVIAYHSLDGLQVEGHHLAMVKSAGRELSKLSDLVFRIPGAEREFSCEEVADLFIFRQPDEIKNLPADGPPVAIRIVQSWPKWGDGLEMRDLNGTWVPLKNLTLSLRITRRVTAIEWRAAEYFQLVWNDGLAWAMRGEGILDGEKVTVVIPIRRSAGGGYYVGRPRVIGDLEVFVQVAGRVVQAGAFNG